MEHALEAARKAAEAGEVPVGAVIVHKGEIIVCEQNRMRRKNDPTAHAEMMAIRAALKIVGTGRLENCDLYVTLEPCTMCAGAIAHVRLRRVCFGAEDEKAGALENGVRFFAQKTCHHRPEIISGIGAKKSAAMLIDFFAGKR
ncbi:tRNA-specific adenosine-34 deaminase [hydrothermal vent metagenome]|uniref:tRNA-specific adenosine deaminase 2 n=1 Tax=hydrothermal vent metagenome TaxID=652676 RepID=A0A3B0TTP4_9ZZZZ